MTLADPTTGREPDRADLSHWVRLSHVDESPPDGLTALTYDDPPPFVEPDRPLTWVNAARPA
jgi:hypothetical protein